MEKTVKLDFKKLEKEYYYPKKVELINVPEMNYITISGQGAPSALAFQEAITRIYPVAYALSMSYKKNEIDIPDFVPFVVPPLEGLWTSTAAPENEFLDKSQFVWKIMLRMPDFIKENHVKWAKDVTAEKKKSDFSSVNFESITDGLCVQALHLGSFDDEAETFAKMEKFANENGYIFEMRDFHHREIYLSDFRKTAPEKLKTVIRQYIKEIKE